MGFPVHAHRRLEDTEDPLAAMDRLDYDGVDRALRPGLPEVVVPSCAVIRDSAVLYYSRRRLDRGCNVARQGSRPVRRCSCPESSPWPSSA
jgi:hypothetical protein